ncbi:dihydrolipoyllysine-residue acetyltransferase [Salinicola acroporae]|uniref:Dihydrolipoamide acetyltransferase component of pyruvate dehydrogenase complex n=1 Tax=Salinicola acroporae TaxID=1541440 RepID=A0ABT6I2A3_9GAMM|nr:dihydrolipoyllysine-residue acetyltransferase [Salinicola acroporae]MDH4571445.1 dihydrolipoamide acetyltransferase [Salinicola acroporae]
MSDFLLPDIGEGIVECEVVKWLVSEGDTIAEDQPVAEVTTDKALVEIPAPEAGRVTRLYVREGETARVHAPLFAIESVADSARSGTDTRPHHDARPPQPAAATPEDENLQPPGPDEEGTEPARSKDFILPDLGEGIVECEVVAWHVEEGDEIAEDQPVVEVSTDKAVMEITAPEAGRLVRRYCQLDEVAKVHSPLFAYIPQAGDEFGPSGDTPAATGAVPRETHAQAGKAATHAAQSGAGSSSAARSARDNTGRRRIPASPAVRRRVRELGLTLDEIPGSGKDGRVLKEDVLAFQQRRDSAADTAQPTAERGAQNQTQARSQSPTTTAGETAAADRIEPLKGIRAVMARRMSEAAASIPHFAYGDEFDVTELLALRERLKASFAERDERLTLMPLLMKALALAVSEFPLLNCRFDAAAEAIHYQPGCHIGMAVDSQSGLLVPNVKHVEGLSLRQVASEVERLTRAAREGRVSPADLKGGTISISNIGVLGGTYAMPIINAPEVAIVALGRVQRLPRFDAEGRVVARSIMTVTWSGDHRVLDGGTMARFCNRWKGYLEAPESMLTELR